MTVEGVCWDCGRGVPIDDAAVLRAARALRRDGFGVEGEPDDEDLKLARAALMGAFGVSHPEP